MTIPACAESKTKLGNIDAGCKGWSFQSYTKVERAMLVPFDPLYTCCMGEIVPKLSACSLRDHSTIISIVFKKIGLRI